MADLFTICAFISGGVFGWWFIRSLRVRPTHTDRKEADRG